MTEEEIIAKAESFGNWYHEIPLTPTYTTKSVMTASKPIWEMIRRVRNGIAYKGKFVLDLGTMDGMWAFEAEGLGASETTGADIWQSAPMGRQRCEFAIKAKNSKVEVFLANVHNLPESWGHFQIIQCLGMLYHVENPILALTEIRNHLDPNGVMLLETAVWTGGGKFPVVRLNTDRGVYCDHTTFWVPNLTALMDMLKLAGFEPVKDSMQQVDQLPNKESIRVAMICKPA